MAGGVGVRVGMGVGDGIGVVAGMTVGDAGDTSIGVVVNGGCGAQLARNKRVTATIKILHRPIP